VVRILFQLLSFQQELVLHLRREGFEGIRVNIHLRQLTIIVGC
jgi:hypothetical protein